VEEKGEDEELKEEERSVDRRKERMQWRNFCKVGLGEIKCIMKNCRKRGTEKKEEEERQGKKEEGKEEEKRKMKNGRSHKKQRENCRRKK